LSGQIERLEAGQFQIVRTAGTVANLLVAIVFYRWVRPLRDRGATEGLFAWLVASLSGAAAGAFPMVSMAVNRGDWAWFTVGVEAKLAWTIAILAAAAIVLIVAMLESRSLIELFLGRGADRSSRLRTLTTTSGGACLCVGAVLWVLQTVTSGYPFVVPIFALTGAAGLAAPRFLVRLPRARTPHRPDSIESHAGWLLAGALSFAALVAASSLGYLR